MRCEIVRLWQTLAEFYIDRIINLMHILCTYALISHISHLISQMRVMAFDYGTKRIGIAVTDPMQIIATGLDTIHPKDIIEYLKKYLQTEQVERFIVGEPKQMDNTPSQSAIHVKGFVNLLKKNFPGYSYRNAGRTLHLQNGIGRYRPKRHGQKSKAK